MKTAPEGSGQSATRQAEVSSVTEALRMTWSRQATPRDRYRIVARWQFGALPTAAFDDVEIETIAGMTVLLAWVRDDQELSGLLDRMRDHDVEIESVIPTAQPSDFDDREADLGGVRWQTT